MSVNGLEADGKNDTIIKYGTGDIMSKNQISRRTFIKGLAAGAASVTSRETWQKISFLSIITHIMVNTEGVFTEISQKIYRQALTAMRTFFAAIWVCIPNGWI